MTLTRTRSLLLVVALAAAGLTVASPAFAATPSPTLFMASTADPAFTSGAQWAADGASARLVNPPTLTRGIDVIGYVGSRFVEVSVAPQSGQVLRPGTYRTTGRPGATASSPSMYITSGSQQLASGGEVQIRDLVADASGAITRFDAVFTTGYDSNSDALFGELTGNEPVSGGVTNVAQHVLWPYEKTGAPVISAVDWLRNTGATPVAVGAPTFTGSPDWSLASDGCTRRSLPAGARCSFTIAYAPTGTGQRTGTLSIPTGNGVQRVELTGTVPPGTTRLDFGGNDYVSGGRQHSYVGGPLTFAVSALPGLYHWVDARPYSSAGPDFGLDLRSADAPPTVGRHVIDPNDPRSDSFALTAEGRACGSYRGTEDVTRFDVDADGFPTSVDLSFTMTCIEDATKPLTGRFQWNAPGTTAPPTLRESLPDPGFESGTGGWVAFTSGSLATASSVVHSGARSLSITTGSSAPALVGMTQNTAVSASTAGATYFLSCWVRPVSPQKLTVRLLEYPQNFSASTHLTESTVDLAAGVWTRVSASAAALRAGERIIPQLYSTTETAANGPILYDDCSLTHP